MKMDLFDLPKDEIYVKLNEKFNRKLFDRAINLSGSQSKLAKILKDSNEKFTQDLKNIRQQEVSGWYNNYRLLRLDLAKFLIDFTNMSIPDLQQNIEILKGIGTSKPIYNPKFPIILDYEMGQLLGKICGDGCVQDDNSYTTSYNNKCDELIKEFEQLFIKNIGNTNFYERENNGVKVITVTGLMGKIISSFFDFKHSKTVPKCIMQGNENAKRGFLRSIFDDEATVNKIHGEIRLKMKYYNFVSDIKKLLNNLGIITSEIKKDTSKNRFGKVAYYFTITGRSNLTKLLEMVGFTHPKKMKRLVNRINSYKEEQYLKGEPQNLIFNILLKYGPKTAKEIAKIMNRNKRTVQFHLDTLKNKDLIFYKKIKRKFNYEYLWVLKK